MTELVMMIGVPGCGKSTLSQNVYGKTHEIVSSDKIREEMLGEVNDQNHNADVFTEFHNRVVHHLLNGENVVCDATKIKFSNRKEMLSLVPAGVKTVAVVFLSLEKAKKQNKMRERCVPESVIDRMAFQFEMPHDGEFDEVYYIF